jgi:tRNA (adenine57-N1/adenine58-N1)-methyltransferase
MVGPRGKNFLLRLKEGGKYETHRGILHHDDLIGKSWGTMVSSHLGRSFMLLQPSLADLMREIRRNTQIMYPKDVGFILVTMGIGPGQHVVEAGTGSGSLTTALAFMVGPGGRVTTYEQRPEFQKLAIRNLTGVGLDDRVTFKTGDIANGFEERGVDALFLDVANPYDYLHQVREALKPGGFFGSILPTVNQVEKLLVALGRENFAFIEVCELLLRYYKPVPDRMRPTDRMVAHTGYLVFARPVLSPVGDFQERTSGELAKDERFAAGGTRFIDASLGDEDAYREDGNSDESDAP